jgi:threonine/homoserine/homoserine lactone efflux protein
MLEIDALPIFLAAALLVAVTPGPGIFHVAARTLAGGRGEGLAPSTELGLGGLVHVTAGAVGVSALVKVSAEAITMLTILCNGSAAAALELLGTDLELVLMNDQ